MKQSFLFTALLLSLSANIYLLLQRKDVPVLPVSELPLNQLPPPLMTPQQDSKNTSPQTVSKANQAQIAALQWPTAEWLKAQLERGHMVMVEDILSAYLQEFPNDGDYLLVESALYHQTRPLIDALSYDYQLLDRPLPGQDIDRLRKYIYQQVLETVSALRQKADWVAIAELLEPLLQLDPLYKPYILWLAEAYAEQDYMSLFEDTLANILPQDPDALRLRKKYQPTPLEPITPNRQTPPVGIPLTRSGSHFLLDVNLDNHPLSLLIDTGASVTSISRHTFLQLQQQGLRAKKLGITQVSTGNGNTRAEVIQINRLTLGEYQLEKVNVLVLPDLALDGADGLLGMNVLKHWQFQLDQVNNQLLLD